MFDLGACGERSGECGQLLALILLRMNYAFGEGKQSAPQTQDETRLERLVRELSAILEDQPELRMKLSLKIRGAR